MKKKFKIILLIATILLFILFLFASCRKTKALERPYFQGSRLNITSLDTNSVFIGIYEINENSVNEIPFQMEWTTQGGYSYGYITLSSYDTNNYSLDYVMAGHGSVSNKIISKDKALYYYVVIGGNQTQPNSFDVAMQFGFIYLNKNALNSYIDYSFNNYYFGNIPGQEQDEVFDSYNTSNIGIFPLATNTSTRITSLYNFYILDMLDYQTLTFSEYVEDIKDEYIKISDNFLDLYTAGYNAGYQSGYDDGYSAGESAGYTAGYNAGLSAGYDNGYRDGESAGYQDGYNAGLSAGYNNGYDAGYDDARDYWQPIYYQLGYEAGEVAGYDDGVQAGYNSGYNAGYEDGQAGRTAVSPVFNIISGVFDVVASVLGIYLFPGITIGTFILVPLFFSIIGLVIWVWKKG